MPLIASTGKPRIILGCMTFGPDLAGGARITSLDEYKQQLDYLQSKGYNEIDTARSYVAGRQEAWTRQAGWKERGLKLATKHYPNQPGEHKPENLRAALETSLKELGTDQVDIYYLHAPDRSVPFAETLEEVNKLHKEGKFVELGLSNFTAFEVAEIAILCAERGWVRPTIFQAMYNAISECFLVSLPPQNVSVSDRTSVQHGPSRPSSSTPAAGTDSASSSTTRSPAVYSLGRSRARTSRRTPGDSATLPSWASGTAIAISRTRHSRR
jgi:aflatoxin B1 aldehyde reductase